MISGGGFLDIFKKIIKPLTAVGAVAAAPFTAGTSLSWLPAALAGGSVASGELPGGGGGGGGDMKWWENPNIGMLGGALLSGIGGALKSGQESKAARELLEFQALGPIRGGTNRAGNFGRWAGGLSKGMSGLNPSDYELLGKLLFPGTPLPSNPAQSPSFPAGRGFEGQQAPVQLGRR